MIYITIILLDLKKWKYQKTCYRVFPKNKNKYNISIGKVQKLIPTFGDKNKCPSLWKFTVASRFKIKIDQSINLLGWKDTLITQQRTQVKNSFEKDFFKLMKNFVFGETMENIRQRVVDLWDLWLIKTNY